MPKNVPPELEEKFRSCKEQVMASGETEEAAYGICYLSVVEGKSLDEAKIGQRNNMSDQARLQTIHDYAVENGAQCGADMEEVEMDTEKTVVHFGNTVKSLGDGRVGGYLVTFGGTDLDGDQFLPETDFGELAKLPVMYHHGFDQTIKTRRIGTAEIKRDEVGLWAEAQLSLRDDYERMILELAEAGKLGWSSGAASHTVTRSNDSKSNTRNITQWYIAEASLTPTPAESRNQVMTLKSYIGDNKPAKSKTEGSPEASNDAVSEVTEAAGKTNNLPIQETKTMEITPEIQALMDASAENAVKKFRDEAPPVKAANIAITRDATEQPFENPGQYYMAVKNAAQYPSRIDERLNSLKAASGLNESVPSQGGFLVPTTISAGIIDKMYNTGSLMNIFPRETVTGNAMTYNVNDETSRANGSRWGGVTGYWLAEAASKTSSKPAFRQLELKLKKVAALCYATDELLEDASALESWIMNAAPQELRFNIENAMINGNGVGKPYGILPSPALISVTRNDATEVDADDILTMWSRRYTGYNDYVWLGNQQIFSQLAQLVVGNMPVFLPAGGLSGLPYNALLGRPYYDVEYMPTLGEIGDLLLVSPSAYKMIEKSGGVQAAKSIEVGFLTDESVFRFVYRIDGAPLWQSSLTGYDGITYSPFVSLTTST